MKKNEIKNLRVLAASLCLSTTLLVGCNNDNEVKFGQSTINYENEIPEGTISYKDLSNNGKVVNLSQNNVTDYRLLIKKESHHVDKYTSYDYTKYSDLKTGVTLIEYYDYSNGEVSWTVGKNLEIISEIDITEYLLQEDFIKREYTVEEILTFYNEKILPSLDSSEKELIK